MTQMIVRGALRLALLLAFAGQAVHATDALAVPPSGVIGTTDAQLDPSFWVARAPNANKVLLDADAVRALNAKVASLDPSMRDIRHMPPTLPRAQVQAWVSTLTHARTAPLFDDRGSPVPAATLEAVMANARLDAIPPSVAPRYGMAVRRAPLRGYPTDLRVFSHAGDSDIDRFQESTLFPGDPVVAVHTSADGKWAFAVSSSYAAWVHMDDIAFGDAATIFHHADAVPFRVITGATATTVHTPESPALSELQLDMGTRVPLDTSVAPDQPVNGQTAYAAWPLSLPVRGADGALSFHPALLQRNQPSSEGYLPLTRANIIRQAFRFLGERYGWGHAYNGRDCSGFVSDVYRSMGVQMPRNTGDQADSPGLTHTTFTAADDHDARLKAAMALQPGDMVYIPGHVMLVIGRIDGQPYVIHDVAGIRYRQPDGRLRSVKLNAVSVTPLLPLMYDDTSTFVDHMTSIVRIRPATPNDDAAAWSDARQMIVVTTESWNADQGTLRTYSREGDTWHPAGDPAPVTIGSHGSAWGLGISPPQTEGPQKHEGDGRSPAGVFRIGKAFGYAESHATALPYIGLTASDYCVDVEASPYYNQLVDEKQVGAKAVAGATEAMRRDLHFHGDRAYRIGFVIEQNPDGEKGAGSCVFAHLWKSPTSPTAGCTAMTDATMERLLAWLDPRRQPVFVLMPRAEYEQRRQAWHLPAP